MNDIVSWFSDLTHLNASYRDYDEAIHATIVPSLAKMKIEKKKV